MKLNIFETFAGVGSQHTALKNLFGDSQISLVGISEWDIFAVLSYYKMNGYNFDENYSQSMTDQEVRDYFKDMSYSLDSKKKSKKISEQPIEILRKLYEAHNELRNIPDINDLQGKDIIEREVNLLTYSFPCQDLSNAGHGLGMSKESNTRSGLLWEVERVLEEVVREAKESLPKYLLMENVTAIVDKRHKADYSIWKKKLEELGYTNIDGILDARDFGIPQSRKRFFCISILNPKKEFKELKLDVLLKSAHKNKKDLSHYLRLDYSNPKYKLEADSAVPNHTKSRVDMFARERKLSRLLVHGDNTRDFAQYVTCAEYTRTLTTKQDRWNNGGMHEYFEYTFDHKQNEKDCSENPNGRSKFRFLTPREAFLLMGFDEEKIESVLSLGTSNEKYYRQAGNSIVVDVLQAIFSKTVKEEEEACDEHREDKGNWYKH